MNKQEQLRNFEGCHKKIDNNGYCWYISSRGNLRICPKCKKKRELLIKELNGGKDE
jgi:hypothetical protein